MKRIVTFGVLLLLVLALAGPILAQVSGQFDLTWHIVSSGGGPRSSARYQIDDVLGGGADGRTSSAHFQIDPGYWYSGNEQVVPANDFTFLPVVVRPSS